MALLTLQNVYDAFGRMKRDISDVPTTDFIDWGNYANRQFYNFILGIDTERYISNETYTVSSEPQTSALPSDFMSINYTGCGFYEIGDDSKDTEYNLAKTGHGRRDAGYYLLASNVIFTGIEDSTQYRLRYIPLLTTLTDLSDTTVLDEIYLQAFVNDIDVLYSQWDNDPSMESIADFRFSRTLDELGDTVSRDVNSYQVPDASNFF